MMHSGAWGGMRGGRHGRSRGLGRGRGLGRMPAVLGGWVAVAALAGTTAACGNVTSGGFGEVEVLISSDSVASFATSALLQGWQGWVAANVAPGAAPIAAPGADGGAAQPAGLQPTGETLRGTLTVTVRSYVRLDRARWIEITDGPQQLTIPLEDPTPVLVARAELPEGKYEGVRTVFGRLRVHVASGLTAGGVPFTGELQVPIGPGGILVAEERGIRVERNRPLPLLLELRARRWLPFVDRERREVDEGDFVREFRVRTPAGR